MSEDKKKEERHPETNFLPPLSMVLTFFDKTFRKRTKKDAQKQVDEKNVEKLIEKLSEKEE